MIPCKLLHPNAKLPTKSHENDAGWDLYAIEDGVIMPSRVQGIMPAKIRTGIALEIPKGLCGIIKDRSSLGSRGLHILGGVIDCDYRGEILICMLNRTSTYNYKAGDRLAQMLLVPVPLVGGFFAVSELGDSKRFEGGFGSTGK